MISVVIPARNAAKTISACIVAINRQTFADQIAEIIVVDNGSVDDTADLAIQAGATVICEPQGGAAAARNAGLQAANGEIVCFTDADCYPLDGWVEALTAPLREDKSIVGAKGTYLTRQPELVARFVQIEYEDKYDLLRPQKTIDFIDTYSAAYRRDILLANDGFDPRIYFVEDQELSFRLAARGYKMVFRPEAAVFHEHSHTLAGYFRKKFFIAYWKAQVVRRFPTRGVKDSHTPQVLKLQMALLILSLGAATGLLALPLIESLWPTLAWRWYAFLPLAGFALFFLTTIPFTRKAWPKDRQVALAAPALLAVRALALSLGYLWGLFKPDSSISGEDVATISGWRYLAKRVLDLVGGLAGLTLTALLTPLISLGIRLDSPGPIIFRQERIGQEGRPFTLYKFRSMIAEAEDELPNLVNLDLLKDPAFKLQDDPRVTRFGRFLRRWSLDELPQFWNVVRGDMSLVGPRPEESRIVALYEDWHRRRLAVKPGLTGPMQVNGRGDLPFPDRIRLEIDYIENYSLGRDLVLIVRTIPSLLTGKGAR